MSTKTIRLLSTPGEMQRAARELKSEGKTIGVVPTMGALHEGHLSLVRESLKSTDVTVVTIFVNPTQFAPTEDLDKYPRPFDNDIALLEEMSVDFVFAPEPQSMYPPGCSTKIDPPVVSKKLEGQHRPEHFSGVATVVLKLLNVTSADIAFFGQKDFQQTLVIKHMVRDLNVSTEIFVCPIIREPDGLAMSSRNVFLSPPERKKALAISQALDRAQQILSQGETNTSVLQREMMNKLTEAKIDRVDYALVVDTDSLETTQYVKDSAVALIAAYIGDTRLIDNAILQKESTGK